MGSMAKNLIKATNEAYKILRSAQNDKPVVLALLLINQQP